MYSLRGNREFNLPFYRLNSTRCSFFPSTAKVWNILSPPVKDAESVPAFKRLCFKPKLQPNKYYLACSGKEGSWITRLRLGLSPLNLHRFTYHLINDSSCPHCLNVPETTEHFIFFCPHYAAARTVLFKALGDLGVNVNAYSEVISEILHGKSFINKPNDILKPVISFLKSTKRFK